MKVITEKGIQQLENELNAMVTNDNTDFKLKLLFTSLLDLKTTVELFVAKEIEFVKENKYLIVSQVELLKLVDKKFFTDERVWPTTGGQLIPTKDMDHQRLSNCIGLLSLLLESGKIDKESADVYLARLEDSIVPELHDRFGGDVLPYQPYFEWEKKLAAEQS